MQQHKSDSQSHQIRRAQAKLGRTRSQLTPLRQRQMQIKPDFFFHPVELRQTDSRAQQIWFPARLKAGLPVRNLL
jgi:hypothetical protein